MFKGNVIYQPGGRAREYSPYATSVYSGCEHGCKYCYVPKFLKKNKCEFHANINIRYNYHKKLEKDARKLFELYGSCNVLLSFTTDTYQSIDIDERHTRRALEILIANGHSFTVLTKAGIHAQADYDLFRPGKDYFATTLTTMDKSKSQKWEPSAASPQERANNLICFNELNIGTWVSIEPVIEPDESINVINTIFEYVDVFRVGKLNHHSKEKEVDWRQFAMTAKKMLDKNGSKYIFKEDLKRYL